LANGYRRGFWLSLAQYVGLLVGVLLGAASARYVLDYLQISNASARPLGAVLVLVIGGSLGSSIGFAVGEPIRRKILRTGIHTSTDSIAGAALSAFAVLLMCWFLGLSFSRGPSADIAQQIQRSVFLRSLDAIAPRPPPLLASVEQVLSGVQFPPVFAGLELTLPGARPHVWDGPARHAGSGHRLSRGPGGEDRPGRGRRVGHGRGSGHLQRESRDAPDLRPAGQRASGQFRGAAARPAGPRAWDCLR